MVADRRSPACKPRGGVPACTQLHVNVQLYDVVSDECLLCHEPREKDMVEHILGDCCAMQPVRDWTRGAPQHTLGWTPPEGDGEMLHLIYMYGREMDTPIDGSKTEFCGPACMPGICTRLQGLRLHDCAGRVNISVRLIRSVAVRTVAHALEPAPEIDRCGR